MRIEIEIPKEFGADYAKDKFSDFFGRVMADINYNGLCGKYEQETAEILAEAFKNSRPAYDVDNVVKQLEYESARWKDSGEAYNDEKEKGVAVGFQKAIEIVKGGGVDGN